MVVAKRNCKKGYSCGRTCISENKQCRVEFRNGGLLDYTLFPDDVEDLVEIKFLGGSTGASLVEDPATGRKYVMKTGTDNPDHIREEFLADRIYEAAGVPVPKGRMYGNVKLTEYLEGAKPYKDLTDEERASVDKQLQKHFALDAIMANWDVIGNGRENVLVTPDGTPYRVDNGGSLRFRAQGGPKGDMFGLIPEELNSLRQRKVNWVTARAYKNLSVQDIRQQVQYLSQNKSRILRGLEDPVLKRLLLDRIQNAQNMEIV